MTLRVATSPLFKKARLLWKEVGFGGTHILKEEEEQQKAMDHTS